MGVQLFSYVNTFVCSMISMDAVHVSAYALWTMLQNVAIQITLLKTVTPRILAITIKVPIYTAIHLGTGHYLSGGGGGEHGVGQTYFFLEKRGGPKENFMMVGGGSLCVL